MDSVLILTSDLPHIEAFDNTEDTTINLSHYFDDPRTTGLVAHFEFDSNTFNNLENKLANPANNPNQLEVNATTDVVLFDQIGEGAPSTVQNFLNYVNSERYVNSIIHRSVPGFVVQGGGFTVDGLADNQDNRANAVRDIPTDPPVVNEFSEQRSNLRGTIAMAKLGGDPNSATNQWFFNLADNSANLDSQNGGFTVFGEVLGQSDLDNLDGIASVDIFDGRGAFGQGAFQDLPLIVENPANIAIGDIGDDNFVRYQNITVSQQPELIYEVVNNSNPDLVNPIISHDQLVLDYVPEELGTAEITIRATDLTGAHTEESTFSVSVEEFDGTANFIRFQNSAVPGTYLYATGAEAQNIRNNFPGFVEEGVAFNAAIEPKDELFPFYRFQSNQRPGTYLFVGEEERNGINGDPNLANAFTEEGVAFYTYGVGASQGIPFSRFHNSTVPGTYLYATGAEADGIRAEFPNFEDEGIAFETLI
ncbi:MAG: peptidylprolyl isomerase [Xenococcus sp. (in: cyanobacteria)]